MDTDLLKIAILTHIYDVPVGLPWKNDTHGHTRNQIKALHLYVDVDDVNMAKPLVSALYPSKPGNNHNFPRAFGCN